MRMRTSNRSGTTLLEMVVSLGIFAVIGMLLFVIMNQSLNSYVALDNRQDAQRRLRVPERDLLEHIKRTGASRLQYKRISTTAGQGDVVWFLSAIDPADGTFRRDAAGIPEWQRTEIYYLVRPSNHDAMVGYSCGTDPDPAGDGYCPHKFLVWKRVDRPGAPEPMMDATEIDEYTTAPDGYDTNSFTGETGLEDARILSDGMLWFQVRPQPPFLDFDLRVVRVREAEKSVPVGATSLLTSTFTVQHVLRMSPLNN
ncbi:MAG: hypothetical protein HY319_26720 [Armatimonadetes bacterium]|nr:hypothetical protein [Armatimonadota bacterium]